MYLGIETSCSYRLWGASRRNNIASYEWQICSRFPFTNSATLAKYHPCPNISEPHVSHHRCMSHDWWWCNWKFLEPISNLLCLAKTRRFKERNKTRTTGWAISFETYTSKATYSRPITFASLDLLRCRTVGDDRHPNDRKDVSVMLWLLVTLEWGSMVRVLVWTNC